MTESWIPPLLQAFELGALRQHCRLQSGLLQETWRLETNHGLFIAQKLHPIFAEGVTVDGQIISQQLRDLGFPTPEYLTTQTGDLHLHLDSGRWRVMRCLPGFTHRHPPSLDHLHQVGWMVGHLHQALATLDHTFHFQIPHFHDTPYLWQKLKDLPVPPSARQEAFFLLERVPELFLPEELPRQIIHGDLKIVNFLFDDQGQITGILDFDTLMVHSLYVELGDGLRSWTRRGTGVDRSAFQASLAGYRAAGALANLEPELIWQGFQLITLELGIRFLIDVVEDFYFDWDSQQYPDRPSHNLARCRRQIELFQDSIRQQDDLRTKLQTLWS